MKREVAEEEEEEIGFMMTPMIDIVFQLIVFFMLVLDITQAQVEAVELPKHTRLEKVPWVDPSLLIVNINKDGVVKIGGMTYYDPKVNGDDVSKLETLFRQRRITYPDPTNANFAKYPVLIRADKDASWEHVQRLEQVASLEGGVTQTLYSGIQETN